VAQFLMSHVDLSPNVTQMLLDHAMGHIADGQSGAVEEMMNTTIEQIYKMKDAANTTDMWDTQYDESEFAPEYDERDDWDEEEEDEDTYHGGFR